ncbi:MAG: MBL fold metallo-hydrolase [Ilumatobacter sp.]
MTVSFHGVRGSTPCHGPEIVEFGGNTSCVSIDIPGADPILFDLGTGLRYFGQRDGSSRPFTGSCLVSHLHWDHIQGLPFFAPLLTDGASVQVYAPVQEDGTTVAEVFDATIRPPLFPIDLEMLPGHIEFRDVGDERFSLGSAGGSSIDVLSRFIPHIGPTVGYRVEWNGQSVAYLSDHQMPIDGSFSAERGALELCRDVDLLIHDAQYTPAEFERKSNWGHCTLDYAVWLAVEAGAKRLALFHHDPAHHDDELRVLVEAARVVGAKCGVDVFGAREGVTVELRR